MSKQLGRSLLVLCLVATAMAVPTNQNKLALRELTRGADVFNSAFFKTTSEQYPGNLITSPISVHSVLTMAAVGAGGNTLKQFKQVLHLPTDLFTTKTGSQMMIDSLNDVKNVTLLMKNKMFISQNFEIKPQFMEDTTTYFRSSAARVPFGNPVAATNTINSWCEQQTNNRIKDLLQPSDVNAMTAMVLVNAVYFKGNWKTKFNQAHTTDRPFHVDATTVKNVPTMYIKEELEYAELPELKATVLLLPYEGEQMSMVIVLPNEVDGLPAVIEKMQSVSMDSLLGNLVKRDVKVYLPKFKIESTVELDSALQELGLTDMYSNQADFSGISSTPLAITKAVQKAFIEVNEEGSEAAAATAAIFMIRTGLRLQQPAPIIFQVNKPFLYVIKYKDLPIFVGSVSHLSGSTVTPSTD